MAKLKTLHKAAVISTELAINDIKKVEALNPDALAIKNADGEVIFKVGVGKEESVSRFGVVFAGDSKISVLLGNPVDRATIEEKFGATLLRLSEVERQVSEYLETVDTNLSDLIEIDSETRRGRRAE